MLQEAATLQAHYPLFAPMVTFLFGAAIGSFINVVVYRLPIMLTRDWQQQSLEILADATDKDLLVADLAKRLPPLRFVDMRCKSVFRLVTLLRY